MPQNVIVGIDGSEASRSAFHEAVRQAEWRACGVTALHNVPYPVYSQYELASIDPVILTARGKTFAEQELHELEAAYADGFPVPVDSLVVQGHAGTNIVDAASTAGPNGEGAELVVLGSRGYGAIRGPLLGSVTTFAVHHLSCPLLIIPPQKEH